MLNTYCSSSLYKFDLYLRISRECKEQISEFVI